MKRLSVFTLATVLSIISGLLQVSTAEETSNRKIIIAVKEFPPLVYKDTKGFCIDLAEIICRKHLLKPKFVMYDSVPDLIEAVQTGVCDIGFAGITITAEREKIIDFSQPFFETGLTIAVKNEPMSRFTSIGNAVLKVIGLSIVLLFVGLTIVAHLIWWIERDDQNPQGFSETYIRGITDAYWWAVVTMSTVGYGDKCPKKISGKAIAAIWMFIGIIWFAGLTATLSSALTVDRIRHGDIADLSDLRGKRVAVLRSTTSEDFLRYHNVKMIVVDTYADLLAALKQGRAEAVVYDAPPLLHEAKLDPDIKVVGELFAHQQYGIVFPDNGREDLKELFNIEILKSRQNGDYRKIYAKWF
jgi:polar amino acid transport system substrate-binding protein